MASPVISSIRYHPLERLPVSRPVHRLRYVTQACKGKRVLDVGAYDETEIDKPQHRSWRWAHAEIARSAAAILGVDGSPKLRDAKRIRTPVGTEIVYALVEDMDTILREFRPDIVFAGELIEHTSNTLDWLARIGQVLPGTRLILTTPNATSLINIALSFINRENNHHDHLHIYSYKTLATLARKLKMTDVILRPYYYHSEFFRGRVPSWIVPLIYCADYLFLTPLQYLFPLTSGGWILEGTLGVRASKSEAVVSPSTGVYQETITT